MNRKIPVHFEGKDALEHVIEARLKGKAVSAEIHGTEIPGHFSAAADSAKETAFILLVLEILFKEAKVLLHVEYFLLLSLFAGWLFWKVGRSAILGWARLERLHRLIEEERWEIEHHRLQEKEELRALYEAKGFHGKLLDESVEVLMADDNRLLQVMLEEELGLNLEQFEHPLKQAFGALIGVVGAGLILSIGIIFFPLWGTIAAAFIVIVLASGTHAQLMKNKALPAMIWNLATAALSVGAAYLIAQMIVG